MRGGRGRREGEGERKGRVQLLLAKQAPLGHVYSPNTTSGWGGLGRLWEKAMASVAKGCEGLQIKTNLLLWEGVLEGSRRNLPVVCQVRSRLSTPQD